MSESRRQFYLSILLVIVLSLLAPGCRKRPATPTSVPVEPAEPNVSQATLPAGSATPVAELTITTTRCPPPEGWVKHVVQSGETLSGIAARYEASAGELRDANCLSSADEISVGQTIFVPYQLPTPTPCTPPGGWVPYVVRAGDTLFDIALRYRLDAGFFRTENCLSGDELQVGQTVYVPHELPTPTACAPRAGWVAYVVQAGDSLYQIALRYGVGARELQQANCLDSDLLLAGQKLLVPYAMPTVAPVRVSETVIGVPEVLPRSLEIRQLALVPPPFRPTILCKRATGWIVVNDADPGQRELKREQGVYYLEARQPYLPFIASPFVSPMDRPAEKHFCVLTDVQVGLDAKPPPNSDDVIIYGPVCRLSPDNKNAYAFLIRGLDESSIYKQKEGKWDHLAQDGGWQTLPDGFELSDEDYNELSIICRGNTITGTVGAGALKKTLVAQDLDPDGHLVGGAIGFMVVAASTVSNTVEFLDVTVGPPVR